MGEGERGWENRLRLGESLRSGETLRPRASDVHTASNDMCISRYSAVKLHARERERERESARERARERERESARERERERSREGPIGAAHQLVEEARRRERRLRDGKQNHIRN
eukprot:3575698-Pleurochrysis_carterae.AAC.1